MVMAPAGLMNLADRANALAVDKTELALKSGRTDAALAATRWFQLENALRTTALRALANRDTK